MTRWTNALALLLILLFIAGLIACTKSGDGQNKQVDPKVFGWPG